MKKPKISTVSKRCFKLWSTLTHRAFRNKCAVCSCTGRLDAHHVISRKFAPLRYDLKNAILLCPLHHKFSSSESFHSNPFFAYEFLQKKLPSRIEYLNSKLTETKKYTLPELLEIEKDLKRQLGIFESV